MSKMKRADFLLVRIILSFMVWYFLILSFIYPAYYRILGERAEYDILFNKVILKND